MNEKNRATVAYTILLLLVGLIAFSWGFLVHKTKVFPYPHVADLLAYVGPAAQVTTARVPRLSPTSGNEDEANQYWAQELVKGGYIIHLRHGQRERWHDVTAFDAYELALGLDGETSSFRRAVCLTEQGVEESKLVGELFRLAGVEVSTVVSSPSCRARQTAEAAFGRIDQVSNALIHRTALMPQQHDAFAVALRALIDGLEIPAGKNVVLSGHGSTLKYNIGQVVNRDETGGSGMDQRQETGMVILERDGVEVIARHKFDSIRRFAQASLELPVGQRSASATGRN